MSAIKMSAMSRSVVGTIATLSTSILVALLLFTVEKSVCGFAVVTISRPNNHQHQPHQQPQSQAQTQRSQLTRLNRNVDIGRSTRINRNRHHGIHRSSSSNNNNHSNNYPSNDHFVGIWRIISSPNNNNNNNKNNNNQGTVGEGSQGGSSISSNVDCDNLILRVDGSIAGGPSVSFASSATSSSSSSRYTQKAAGGSWKMFQARYVGSPQPPLSLSSSSWSSLQSSAAPPPVGTIQTRLRIRLLIPPKKESELVMEGEVRRIMMMSSGFDAAAAASNAAGATDSVDAGNINPQLLKNGSLKRSLANNHDTHDINNNNDKEDDDDTSNDIGVIMEQGLLHCEGEAWVEPIESSSGNKQVKRQKLGRFSIMKLKTPNRRNLRYSVPVPRSGL